MQVLTGNATVLSLVLIDSYNFLFIKLTNAIIVGSMCNLRQMCKVIIILQYVSL